MTEIDFYTHVEDRLRVACQLVRKAHARKLRVLVLFDDEAELCRLDEQLWTFHPHAFLPHCRIGDAVARDTPVLLACEDVTPPPHEELLINLRAQPPQHFARFQRLLEIVGVDDADRTRGRERFRYYRDRGYPLRTHALDRSSDGLAAAAEDA